jgi:hypothetical protein
VAECCLLGFSFGISAEFGFLMVLLLLSRLRKIEESFPPRVWPDSSSRIPQWKGTTLFRVLNAGNLFVTPQNAPSVTDFAKRTSTGLASERSLSESAPAGRSAIRNWFPTLLDQRFNHQLIIYFHPNKTSFSPTFVPVKYRSLDEWCVSVSLHSKCINSNCQASSHVQTF